MKNIDPAITTSSLPRSCQKRRRVASEHNKVVSGSRARPPSRKFQGSVAEAVTVKVKSCDTLVRRARTKLFRGQFGFPVGCEALRSWTS